MGMRRVNDTHRSGCGVPPEHHRTAPRSACRAKTRPVASRVPVHPDKTHVDATLPARITTYHVSDNTSVMIGKAHQKAHYLHVWCRC